MKTKGQLEAEISDAIVKFEKEYMGRGPDEAKAYVIDDLKSAVGGSTDSWLLSPDVHCSSFIIHHLSLQGVLWTSVTENASRAN